MNPIQHIAQLRQELNNAISQMRAGEISSSEFCQIINDIRFTIETICKQLEGIK